MDQSIESRAIPGVTIKTIGWLIATTVSCSAFVVSTYFIKTGELRGGIEDVHRKVDNVLLQDSMKLKIMQLQIDQLRSDVILNRELLRDIRDTQMMIK